MLGRVIIIALVALSAGTLVAQEEMAQTTAPSHSTEVVVKEVYRYFKPPTSDVYQAVISADLEQIEAHKKGHISFYDYNADGETVFTLAIKLGNLDVIRSLEQQAVINMKNKEGETPLTLAIKSGNIEMINIVLRRAKAALRNGKDETPIYLALDLQNMDLIADLIDRGADVNIRSQGKTPISRAVELNNLKMASLLIQKGADPSKANANGDIPLYLALSKNQKVMAGMLLGKSSDPQKDVDWKNKLGEPMLIIAVKDANTSMVNQLIVFGANVNATDYMDNTALIVAAKGKTEILITLLEADAEMDLQNAKGETAMITAMLNNNQSAMNALNGRGADASIMDYSGNSAQKLFGVPNRVETVETIKEGS